MYLQVTFLNGYWASKQHVGIDWPPSPARLYSALVNGFYTWSRLEPRSNAASVREALMWFENHLPAAIYCGEVIDNPDPPTVYVPLNEEGKFGSGQLFPTYDNRGRVFPVVRPSHHSVYFRWDEAGPWALISEILPYVPYVGTARSFTKMDLVEKPPEVLPNLICYAADQAGDVMLECPYPGRLADLDWYFDKGQYPPTGENRPYVKRQERRPFNNYSPSICDRVYIYSLNTRVFNVVHSVALADAVRNELLHICEQRNLNAQAIIGHAKISHCAYLPLAFVGQQHGNGQVYGMAVAVPKDIPQDEKDMCLTALRDLKGFRYDGQDWPLERVESLNVPYTLRRSSWCVPNRMWSTVTPMEIRWGEGSSREEMIANDFRYVARNCAEQGLPAPVQVRFHSHCVFAGGEPARRFKSRNQWKKDSKHLAGFLTHATIEFKEAVEGPIFLGRGRYFGLGLLKPYHERPDDETATAAVST